MVLQKMGFSDKWTSWMMECVSSASISVLVNGSPTEEFGSGRGLRQGDSLSPFLSLIVVQGLSVMMKKVVEIREFDGHMIGNPRVEITHLQYACDTLLAGEATQANIWTIKRLLQLLELTSGMKVNYGKSQVMRFNLDEAWLRQTAGMLHYKTAPFRPSILAC